MSITRRDLVKGGAAALGASALAVDLLGGKAMAKPIELYADPLYTKPYLDKDEWRDKPIRHRYVHKRLHHGTDLRFSMYFPPKEHYQGRFFPPVMHIAGDENVAPSGRLAGLDGDVDFVCGRKRCLSGGDPTKALFKMLGPTGYHRFQGERGDGAVWPDTGGARCTAITGLTVTFTGVAADPIRPLHVSKTPTGSGTAVCLLSTARRCRCPTCSPSRRTRLRVLDGKFEQIVDALEQNSTAAICMPVSMKSSALRSGKSR